MRVRYFLLFGRALWELLRYDLVRLIFGFDSLYRQLERQKATARSMETVARVCDAVVLASCFYVRPVLCLQRSVVGTRLLRKHGISADLVIGYRPSPFLSHAWIEVDGRIVNDAPAYQQRLQVLSRA